MSAPAPPTPSRLTPPRLLGAVAFAAVGVAAVWQGFGLAGYGTDAHTARVLVAAGALFACGLVAAWPTAWRPVRVIAVLLGLGAAGFAWWEVRSSNLKSAMSLREAAEARDGYKRRLATPTVEEAERSDGLRDIKLLVEQYPSLANDLSAEYDRWATAVADDIVARHRRAPLDDFKTVEALHAPALRLSAAHPASAARLDAARRQWLSNALHAKTHALSNLRPGDWAAFDATAPGRRAHADALPDARDELLRRSASGSSRRSNRSSAAKSKSPAARRRRASSGSKSSGRYSR